MTEQFPNWTRTCKRFVAFMDIMGFRDLVFRKSHDEVKATLASFQPVIAEIEKAAQKRLDPQGKKRIIQKDLLRKSVVRPVFYSDSIILVSSDDSSSSAHIILLSTEWVLGRALRLGIPIKGAIAHGEQTADFDRSIHFGKPVIDAYELQDELLLYGVAIHHTMEQHLIDTNMMPLLEATDLVRWPTPMKAGKITHYLVDWSKVLGLKHDPEATVSLLYKVVSGGPRCYVDNTLDFADELTKRKAKS